MATILIIDDSLFQRTILRKVIGSEGHDIEEAANGEEGLEKISSVKPDLITLDLVMPGLDGLGVLNKLKEMDNQIPVIVVSADVQYSTKKECVMLGAVGFVNKPVQGATIIVLQDLITNQLS